MPLLNAADALFLGPTEVVRAYFGAAQVWPSEAPTTERFGNEGVANDSFPNSEDRAYIGLYTMPENGTILRIGGYFTDLSGGLAGDTVKFIIHENVAGEPGARLAIAAPVTIATIPEWWVADLVAPLVRSAGAIWIGYVASGLALDNRLGQIDGGGQARLANGSYSYASPPSSWPGSDAEYENNPCIYAEYTPT